MSSCFFGNYLCFGADLVVMPFGKPPVVLVDFALCKFWVDLAPKFRLIGVFWETKREDC